MWLDLCMASAAVTVRPQLGIPRNLPFSRDTPIDVLPVEQLLGIDRTVFCWAHLTKRLM
jgi:hypothetical protein